MIGSALPLAASICAALVDAYGHSADISHEQALRACDRVVSVAQDYDVPPALAAALTWHESRLDAGAVSSAGARGVLQVMPRNLRVHGPDPLVAGVVVLQRWMRRSSNVTQAICRYQAGYRCSPRLMQRARQIVGMARRLERITRRGGRT